MNDKKNNTNTIKYYFFLVNVFYFNNIICFFYFTLLFYHEFGTLIFASVICPTTWNLFLHSCDQLRILSILILGLTLGSTLLTFTSMQTGRRMSFPNSPFHIICICIFALYETKGFSITLLNLPKSSKFCHRDSSSRRISTRVRKTTVKRNTFFLKNCLAVFV